MFLEFLIPLSIVWLLESELQPVVDWDACFIDSTGIAQSHERDSSLPAEMSEEDKKDLNARVLVVIQFSLGFVW